MSEFNQFEEQEEEESQDLDETPGNDFLKGVAPEDLPYVKKYIDGWNSQVGKSFEKVHGKYRGYKDLGADPQTLKDAKYIYDMLNEQPEQFYELLTNNLTQQGKIGKKEPEQPAQKSFDFGDPEFNSQFQPYADRIDKMDSVLKLIAERLIEAEQMTEAEKQDAELEKYLGELRSKFGDFDEDYVTAKMLKGMDGVDAVKAFNKLRQSEVNRAARPPHVMGRGNVTPTGQIDTAKMSSTDLDNHVAWMLEQAANERR